MSSGQDVVPRCSGSGARAPAFIEGYYVPAANTRLSIVPSAYGAGSISTIAGSMMIAYLGDPSVNHGNLG